MNIFGGTDNVKKLEALLKQKTVQMDNLDNTLSTTKRDLAEQKREKDAAVQELASQSSHIHDLEQQNEKLNKLIKQKNEYTFSLCSQLEAKNKELQRQEDALAEEKSHHFRLTKEIQDANTRCKALEAELSLANNKASAAERTYRAAQSGKGKEISELSEELISAQHSLEAQQAQLASFEAKVHSGQVDNENRTQTVESLKMKVLDLENQLLAQQSSSHRKFKDMQQAYEDASHDAREAQRELQQLQAVLSAKDTKIGDLGRQMRDLELQVQMASGKDVTDSIDSKTHAAVVHDREQLEQRAQQLTTKLHASETEASSLKEQLTAAASELDQLRTVVEGDKANTQTMRTSMANLKAMLDRQQEDSSTAAAERQQALSNALADLARAEETISSLEAEKGALINEQAALNEKIRRGADAVSRTSQLQEKLESKLLKLSTDKEAALRDATAAKATVKQLERDQVELQRCNAKNIQDRDEARRTVAKLETAVCDLRGQLAERDVGGKVQHHILAAPDSNSGKNYGALREQCLSLEAQVTKAKDEVSDLRAQLKEERGKREEAKGALYNEQQYFARKLAELEGLTKGEGPSTPGGQVHTHIQRIKKQLQAVADGDDVSHVQHRTMLTKSPRDVAMKSPIDVPTRSPLTPRSTLPRQNLDCSTLHTPRSAKGLAAQESAQYWHKRYEEQASKLSQLETSNRALKVQLLRSGGTADSLGFSFSGSRTPGAKTPTLCHAATPPTRTRLSADTSGPSYEVRRELDFGKGELAEATPTVEEWSDKQESAPFGSASPVIDAENSHVEAT